VVDRPVGSSIGRPVAGCWPRLLAFQRGPASRCSGTVSLIGRGRIRRVHSPVIDSSGALGATNHPFTSTAGSVDSGPIGGKGGAVDHVAALNGRGARSPAARAATCTADHGAINTTVLDGRDAVSIPGHATDDAAEPSNTAWPDCWRAVSGGARALNFAVRAGPGSDGRGPISPVTAADARRSRYVGRQPPAGPGDAASPGVLSRACGRDHRAADARIYSPLPAAHRDQADRVAHGGRGQPSGHDSIDRFPHQHHAGDRRERADPGGAIVGWVPELGCLLLAHTNETGGGSSPTNRTGEGGTDRHGNVGELSKMQSN
jgi:hypothetical protein